MTNQTGSFSEETMSLGHKAPQTLLSRSRECFFVSCVSSVLGSQTDSSITNAVNLKV